MIRMYRDRLKDISLYQILLNECKVCGSAAQVIGELKELEILEKRGEIQQARQTLAAAVEKLSRGENTVLYDGAGVPSVMVRVPAMTCEELLPGCTMPGLHPAFRCGGRRIREIWVSKYLNCVVEGRAASLPMGVPQNARNYGEAAGYIRPKGDGWLLMPFQLRMAILLQCLRRGMHLSGNTDRGHDYYALDEVGVVTVSGTSLTGSGPLSWTHNGRQEGIWDLIGNLNEWDSGFRLVDGEIQLADMEALLSNGGDLGADSPLWRAMDDSGAPVQPGAPGTLRFDGTDGAVRLTHRVEHASMGNCAFCDVSAAADVTVPERLKLLGLYPPVEGLPETAGWRWICTQGEVMPLCGGAYRIVDHSGMFFMGVTKPRDVDYSLSGMRCIYVSPNAKEEECQ